MAVNVVYTTPVSGTTPPTHIQSTKVDMVVATVFFDESDTEAAVVHNFSVPATLLGGQAPVVIVNQATASTAPGVVQVVRTDSDTVTVTKLAANGSQGTFVVTILRPASQMGRKQL